MREALSWQNLSPDDFGVVSNGHYGLDSRPSGKQLWRHKDRGSPGSLQGQMPPATSPLFTQRQAPGATPPDREQLWKLHCQQPATANHFRPLHLQRSAHRPRLGPLGASPSSMNRLVPGKPIPAAIREHLLQPLGPWAWEMPPASPSYRDRVQVRSEHPAERSLSHP